MKECRNNSHFTWQMVSWFVTANTRRWIMALCFWLVIINSGYLLPNGSQHGESLEFRRIFHTFKHLTRCSKHDFWLPRRYNSYCWKGKMFVGLKNQAISKNSKIFTKKKTEFSKFQNFRKISKFSKFRKISTFSIPPPPKF